VRHAITVVLQATPQLAGFHEHLEIHLHEVAQHFWSFIPSNPQGKKATIMASVEGKLLEQVDIHCRRLSLPSFQFVKSIAIGAGKAAVGATMDVLKILGETPGASWQDTLLKVGTKTAEGKDRCSLCSLWMNFSIYFILKMC
jgi:hypothetical protein